MSKRRFIIEAEIDDQKLSDAVSSGKALCEEDPADWIFMQNEEM